MSKIPTSSSFSQLRLASRMTLSGATLAGALALGACTEPEPPNFLSGGANGFVYASPDFASVIVDHASAGPTRTVHNNWIDPELEAFHWVSRWGVNKPWCSLVGPNRLVDWTAKRAQGIEPPKPSLRCLDAKGQLLPRVELPHAFSRAAIDPSQRSVVLFSSKDTQSASNLVRVGNSAPDELFNPKLAGVVDLASGGFRSVVVEGFGAAIKSLAFPDYGEDRSSVIVADRARRLALFFADAEMVMLDLEDPNLSQVAVATRGVGADRPRTMRVLPADADLSDPLLLIASQSPDIEQIRLRAREGRPEALDVDYSILTTVRSATDLEGVSLNAQPWILAATGSGLSMVNLKSAQEHLLSEFGSIQHLETFKDDLGQPHILAWSSGKSMIHTIDPAKALTSLGRRPQSFRLGEEVKDLLWISDHKVAAVGSSSVTVLDLITGKQTPLGGVEQAESIRYPGDKYIFMLGSQVNAGERIQALVRVDLETMVPETIPLDVRLSGSTSMALVNDGAQLVLRIFDPDQQEFGLSVLDTDTAQLSDIKTEVFPNEG